MKRRGARKVLSEHIGKTGRCGLKSTFAENSKEDSLRLLVEPSQVRIVPGLNGPYG